MNFFFDIRKNRVGYSRIGRISISSDNKNHILTPNIIIPLTKSLLSNLDFLEEFEDHDAFIVFDESLLNQQILERKFRNSTVLFYHYGTIERFSEIVASHRNLFLNRKVFPIIPFNLPSTSISRTFTENELNRHFELVQRFLEKEHDINFGFTVRIFQSKSIIDQYIPIIKKYKNIIKALFLIDTFNDLHNFRNILDGLWKLKNELDNNLVLIASGKVLPIYLPTLFYLGIDLVDVSYVSFLSAENLYNSVEKFFPIYKLKELHCCCNLCRGKLKEHLSDSTPFKETELLYLHNLISIKTYMNKVKYYLTYEDFRNFVEHTSTSELNLLSMIRVLDKDYFQTLRYETPLFQKRVKIDCIGSSSEHRPDFEEFRNRVLNNFEPEPWSEIVILLPCSSKKPYSNSKTHRKFSDVTRKFSNFSFFQEFILTSPLGAIPRQLEDIYPVNSYDISVTGDWSEEELQISTNMLVGLIRKYNERIPIVCHIDGQYKEICERAKSKLNHEFVYTEVQDNPTSKESLASFFTVLEEINSRDSHKRDNPPKPIISKTVERKLHKICDYSFGAGSSAYAYKNGIKLRKTRNKNFVELFDPNSNEKLGKLNKIDGLLDITINAGNRLLTSESLNSYITFDDNSITGNNIFRSGIIDYSESLIPGNNVLILNELKTKVLATGRLVQGYNFIKNSEYGKIVEIYEKL